MSDEGENPRCLQKSCGKQHLPRSDRGGKPSLHGWLCSITVPQSQPAPPMLPLSSSSEAELWLLPWAVVTPCASLAKLFSPPSADG